MKEALVAVREGAEYIYQSAFPKGCQGCRYRVLKLVRLVPVTQQLICVEALEGPDKGLWFVCTLMNFAIRYKLAPDAEAK